MPEFHPLKVKEVKRETADTVSVAFDVPKDLKQAYAFEAGQYLTLRTQIEGEEVRRSYSICTSPKENDLRVAVKKVEGGLFSTFANETLKEGDELAVMTPMGNFTTSIDANSKKHYVGVAAGSGITPVISLLKTILDTGPEHSFTLIFGNRSFSTIIFREELEALKNKYLGRLALHHILSREDLGSDIFCGRIDADKSRDLFSKLLPISSMDEVFICGPENMIHDVRNTLETAGFDKKKIHFELFTSPLGKLNGRSPEKKKEAQTAQGAVASSVRVMLDGDSFEFDLHSGGESILDAALATGADLPYACKGGVCCTCRAKLVKGKVDMEVNYALEEEEVEAGFILTCQSHPRSEHVVVDFDER